MEVNGTLADYDGSTNRPVVPIANRQVFFSSSFSVVDDDIFDDDNKDPYAQAIAYTALGISLFATTLGLIGFCFLYQMHKTQKHRLEDPLLSNDISSSNQAY